MTQTLRMGGCHAAGRGRAVPQGRTGRDTTRLPSHRRIHLRELAGALPTGTSKAPVLTAQDPERPVQAPWPRSPRSVPLQPRHGDGL